MDTSEQGSNSKPKQINDVDAVIFDFDGTLRRNEPSGMDYFADAAEQHGLELDAQTRREAARWNHAYWADSDERSADAEAAVELRSPSSSGPRSNPEAGKTDGS